MMTFHIISHKQWNSQVTKIEHCLNSNHCLLLGKDTITIFFVVLDKHRSPYISFYSAIYSWAEILSNQVYVFFLC